MNYDQYSSLIIDHQDAICYIIDRETYEILYLSKAARKLYQAPRPEQWLGQKCYRIIQGLSEPCPFCTNPVLKLDEKYCWEFYNPVLQKYMSLEDTLIKVDGKLCRLEVARDITEQKRTINALESQLTVEETLVRCIETLTLERDMDQAVCQLLQIIGGYYSGSRAYILEFDFQQEVFNNSFEWCASGVEAEIHRMQGIPLSLITDWIRNLQECGQFYLATLPREQQETSPEEFKILSARGIESLLAAPIVKDDKVIGILAVDEPTANFADMTLLSSVTCFILDNLEKRRMVKQLEYLSYTDMLTGLLNRNKYVQILQGFDQAPPDTLGVVFLDINGMKGVNDTFGYSYGDSVILQTASLLKTHMGELAFRIGGDEFVSLNKNLSKEDFEQKVLALRQDAEEQCNWGVSIGWVWKSGSFDVNEEILQAGELMYAEKQDYYKYVLSQGRKARTGVSSEVLQDLEDGRFTVFLQPKVRLKTGEIVGAEALVRKKDVSGKLTGPDKFIPLYEIEGVVRHVDLFVLETVCSLQKRWLFQGIRLRISVNFSRMTLIEPGIVGKMKELCRSYGVSPELVEIEVTESIGKLESEQMERLMTEIKRAGFSISLDDFGSKYSNLNILTEVDFDQVKFDKSLVQNLAGNSKSRIVLEHTIHMCKSFQTTASLAEGVETQEQLELLEGYSCTYGQGYYFAKPMPIEDFEALYRQGKPLGHRALTKARP